MIRGSYKRADYARKHKIYAQVGENVTLQIRKIPLYSQLIKFHNNIAIARNVDFVTHDVIHGVLNELYPGGVFKEHIGCIEIMDNVFVGSNTVILDGVRIGPNVIIASGSVVTKDVEPGTIVAGVPAKPIGSFDDFIRKRSEAEKLGKSCSTEHNQNLTKQEIDVAWKVFNDSHKNKK